MKPAALSAAALLLVSCAGAPLPAQPSGAPAAAVAFSLEGEDGTGDGGRIVLRSAASGGRTVHLGPGERRTWTVDVGGAATFALSITYANGKEGPNETLRLGVDGAAVRTFVNRDSGEIPDGWERFVTDPAGAVTLAPGRHAVTLDVIGGDGCVEIDFVRVGPA